MKLSVSLPEEDVRFLDEYLARAGSASRSSVISEAIGLLRRSSLAEEYAAAFAEWDTGEDAELWDRTAPDASDAAVDAPR
ncbi:ribbon-helix-helix domain-containing protein [Actinokineospora bangkokensis]|uniref:Antitoxin n=1 Tax=Actinokineospora bangkokensis TaxID=1193682 RepID=A0A1Q9LRI6_9PSEU|nr:ribbon-helix-helix domain-containing protein [Actinokineospora bangkokensis]OLR94630.1 antitoxin [Actinokineospora bangkokensis]